MAAFSTGSYVFIPDPDEIVIPALVEATFSAGSEGRVKRLDNERSVKLPPAETKKLVVMHEQSLEGLDDMVNFKHLDESAILHNLRLRYFRDTIYTNIGKILTSVNPFKQLSIYNPQIMDEYMEKGSRNLPAHIFGVADDSFKAMIENQRSQSCIVSGESGAGKTEATKLFLQYISEKSKRASAGAVHERQSGHVSGHIMQQKILESNPLMEAFGNAKTLRNDNSSRFGKWIEIQFDRNSGGIVGGSIKSYLLEKSRLVSQADGERNYHIFYQVCAAAAVDPSLAKYNLTEATQYHYLNQSEEPANSDNINDLDDWEATVNAMQQIGMSGEEQSQIINVLNIVLTTGNILFTGKEQAAVEKKEPVEAVANMLGCAYAELERALVKIYRGNAKEPDLVGNHDIGQACDARDAFAKHLYALLFDWIISKINESLGRVPDNASKISTIGVLDIFGFEFFQKNSLEQLLINFTNERLQGHFNDHIFKLEQEQYAKEGIDVTKIEFVDNENVLQTIDYKTTGILQMIAEELKIQKGTDDTLLKKLKAKADSLKSDPRMNVLGYPDNKDVKNDPELENVFTIQHYAGKVGYRIDQFLEKNRDSVPKLLHTLGSKCKNTFIANLFKTSEDVKKKALGLRFSEQLNELMADLNATQPHFVRTIKPNSLKEKDNFESRMVMEQLRYAGLLEVCRIRQMGYPVRKSFKEFLERYRYLAKGAPGIKSHTDLLAALVKLKFLDAKRYQVGTSKIFLKNDQAEILEEERAVSLSLFVTRMQRIVRGFVIRVLARKWRAIRNDMRKAIKSREKAMLKSALLQFGELPYGGKHLVEYREAQDVMNRIEDEERIAKLLKDAMASKDISQIQTALKAAEQKKLAGTKEAKDAQTLLTQLQKELEVKTQLVTALEKGDEAALKNAVAAATALKLGDSPECKDAVSQLKQIETVRTARNNLQAAVKSKDVGKIKQFMNQLANLGKGDDPLVHQGEEIVHEKAQEAAAVQARKEQALYSLDKAIKDRNLQALNDLEKEIIELGIENDLVKKGRELKHELSAEKDICAKLTAESNAATAKGQTKVGLVESDLDGLRGVIAEANEVLEADDFQLLSAMDDLYKLEQQLKVQVELSKALDKYGTRKREWAAEKDNAKRETLAAEMLTLLKEANRNAQESGTNTDVATEVREKLSQLQLDIDESKRAENQAKREEAAKNLVEASEEDLEQDAAKRAQFNAQFTDLLSQKHRELIQEASDTNRYHLGRFYRLRSDDDFVERVSHDQKEIIAATKLVSRTKPIPKSLCRLDDDQNAIAIRINKAILQYCGDLAATFPGTLAQYVLVRGLEDQNITDEIYLQLMKHISGNDKADSADKTWLLMCMCTKIFPPTNEFAPYLLNFLIQRKTAPGLVGNYARLCIVQLDATIELGPTWFKPNLDEINSYRKRPPILASIQTLEGKQIDYPVTPDMRVAQVLDLVRRKEGVEDDYEHPAWGIYVAAEEEEDNESPKERLIRFYQFYNPAKLAHIDLFLDHWTENPEELFQKLTSKYGPEPVQDDKTKKKGMLSLPITAAMNAVKFLGFANQRDTPPAPLTSWPLPWWTHLGDVYYRMTKQKKVPKFVFKRRLITRTEPVDKWLYLQAVDDIRQGYLPLNDPSKLAQLAALAMQYEHGDKKIQASLSAPALLDLGLTRYLPEEALKQKPAQEYASVVLNLFKKKQVPASSDEVMLVYIDIVRQTPIYGMNFFYARHAASEKNYVISVDVDGIHVLEEDRSAIKRSFGFHTIKKFGATAEYFWMNIDEKQEQGKGAFAFLAPNQGINVLLYTLQSWEMYDCVYDATHIEVE